MRSRAYVSVAVNLVRLHEVTDGHAGQEVVVGMAIGKFEILAVARWPDRSFARPGSSGDTKLIYRFFFGFGPGLSRCSILPTRFSILRKKRSLPSGRPVRS